MERRKIASSTSEQSTPVAKKSTSNPPQIKKPDSPRKSGRNQVLETSVDSPPNQEDNVKAEIVEQSEVEAAIEEASIQSEQDPEPEEESDKDEAESISNHEQDSKVADSVSQESMEIEEEDAEESDSEVGEPKEHCLLCGVNLESGVQDSETIVPDERYGRHPDQDEATSPMVFDDHDLEGDEPVHEDEVDEVNRSFDNAKLETFLQQALQLTPGPPSYRAVSDRRGRIFEIRSLYGEPNCVNFCSRCKVRIARLYELDEKVKKATMEYETGRDRLALKFVVTFLAKTKPKDFPAEVYKSAMAQKWKKLYSGEAEKEKEVLKLLKEKESKAMIREKKLKKLKNSCSPFYANGTKDGSFGNKRRISARQSVGSKPRVVKRDERSVYVVTIPKAPGLTDWCCTICDKRFRYEYSLRLHLRSHVNQTGKLYKCSLCNIVCNTRQKLMVHRRKDHTAGERQLKCKTCNIVYTARNAYKAHMRTHSTGPAHNCEICSERFTSQYYLRAHMLKHENVDFSVMDLFTCKTCSKTFLKSHELTDHLRIHTDTSLTACSFCGKVFSDTDVLNQHLKVHTGSNPFICDECGQRFPSEALHVSHLKSHRPRMHVCKKCNKACRSRDGLRKHELTHTGKKPFSCNICSIGFIERKSFDAHMIRHTGKLPYKCNYCESEEGFRDAKDLRRHKYLKHPQYTPSDKIYACEVCWNGYETQEQVDEHKKKVHERYKCQFCTKVFKLGDHLRRHMYIHTGEKPYKCGLCEKSFNQESNLKEHMYRHTGIRPHRCPHCPQVGYLRRMHLREHMMKAHGTDIVPHIPVGRAAQTSRKSGARTIRSLGVNSSTVEYESDQPEILLSSSNPSNCIIVLQSK